LKKEGRKDGRTAVVMDYVGCARTVQVTPVDGVRRASVVIVCGTFGYTCGIGKEKYPGRVERNVGNVVGRSSVK